jgi:hypothetical protein
MHARAIEHGMKRGRRQVPSAAHDTRTQILILHARRVRSRSLAGMSMSISLSRAGRAALRTKSSVIRGAWCRLRIHRCRRDAPAFQCVHAGGRTVCECLPGYLTPKIKIASSFAQSLQGPNKPSPMRPWPWHVSSVDRVSAGATTSGGGLLRRVIPCRVLACMALIIDTPAG